jgi:hypothetical protein
MTLAQVVYTMSTDRDFASQLFSAPEMALDRRGFKLSREELAFILTAHRRGDEEKTRLVSLAKTKAAGWSK